MAIRKRKPTSDDVLLKQALKQLVSAEKHAAEVNRKKDRAQKVYLGATTKKRERQRNNPRDWRSESFPPIAFEHAELAIAELSDSPPEFEAKARLDSMRDNAKAAEQAVAYYLDRDRFPRTFRTVMRRCVKYGDCPVKVVWKHDAVTEIQLQREPVMDPESGEASIIESEVEVERVVFDGPTVIPLHYEDFLPDPTALTIDNASFVFHRWRATTDDLKSRKNDDGTPFYTNLDQLTDKASGSSNDVKRPTETPEAFEARTTGVNTIHERWTKHGVLAIANRRVIIRRDENPDDPVFAHRKIPFEIIRLIEDDDSLGGVSPMLQIDELQEMYWKFWNALSDAISLAANPPKLIDEESDQNAANYEIYPGANIPARNGEQTVKVMQDIAGLDKYNLQSLLTMIRDLTERTTGMNANIAGSGNSSSATEATSNISQSKGRIRFQIQESDDGWARVVEMVFQLIQQYGDERIVAQLTDGSSVDFSPDELVGQFQFSSRLSSERVLKDQRLNQLMSLWQSIIPIIQPGTVEVDVADILQQMYHVSGVGQAKVRSLSPGEATIEQGQAELAVQEQQMQLQQQYTPQPTPPVNGASPTGA